MKKILSFALSIICLVGCISTDSSTDSIKRAIIETEQARIPLYLQGFDGVFDIQIDSVVFTNNVEPYAGYMITTWDLNEKQNLSVYQWAANKYKDKYVRKNKTVYVPLTNITVNKFKNMVQWNSDWSSTYYDARNAD